MNRLETHILAALESGQTVALATIVSLSGSAPRTPGTRMMIRRDGSIAGTIGGGRLEAEVVRAGLETLRTGTSLMQRFALDGTDAADMDMICGGVLDVLVEPLRAVPRTIELLRTLRCLQADGADLLLVTLLHNAPGQNACLVSEHFLVQRTPSGFRFHPEQPDNALLLPDILETARSGSCPVLFTAEGLRMVAEPIPGRETLHLFGAGHVSREAAALAHRVDFRVEVYDDRTEFASQERFPCAEAIHVPENMAQALDASRISRNSYVVILTRGHQHDMDILAQALGADPAYIGMIGSRRKRDVIYAVLRRQGFSESDLSGVHCPIGLDIEAETPAEIALSIVGELVKIRAAARKRPVIAPYHPARRR